MLRSFFAGFFAIVLSLGLGISSVSAATVEVKLGTDAGMLAFEPSTVNISAMKILEKVHFQKKHV